MTNTVNIICMKWGDKFPASYVNRLYGMISKNITLPFLMPFVFIALTIRSLDVGRADDIVHIMTGGGPAMRTELLWTMIARIGYKDANMGFANAMSYVSIILSIAFTYYFFTKLVAARRDLGQQ